MLAYVRLIPKKVMQLIERLSKYFIRLQQPMHAQREVSNALFSKWNQFWKICSENTLVNCITQNFLFIDRILEVSESFYFPTLKNVWLRDWFDNFYAEDNAS